MPLRSLLFSGVIIALLYPLSAQAADGSDASAKELLNLLLQSIEEGGVSDATALEDLLFGLAACHLQGKDACADGTCSTGKTCKVRSDGHGCSCQATSTQTDVDAANRADMINRRPTPAWQGGTDGDS